MTLHTEPHNHATEGVDRIRTGEQSLSTSYRYERQGTHRWKRATTRDAEYGLICACGRLKTEQALRCRACYAEQRRNETARTCAECGGPKSRDVRYTRCRDCKHTAMRGARVASGRPQPASHRWRAKVMP